MKTINEAQNINITEKLINIIRECSKKENGKHILYRISNIIDWDEINNIVIQSLPKQTIFDYKSNIIPILLKCIILERIFSFSDYTLFAETAEKDIFQKFIGIDTPIKIPKVKVISSFRNSLIQNGLYDIVLTRFYEQLFEAKSEILDYNIENEEKDNLDFNLANFDSVNLSPNKNAAIEDRIRNLYERKFSSILIGMDSKNAIDLKEKLLTVKSQIDGLSNCKFNPASEEYKKMLEVENILIRVFGNTTELEKNVFENYGYSNKESNRDKQLYEKIINSFFNSLNENSSKEENIEDSKSDKADIGIIDNLNYVDKIVDDLKESLNFVYEMSTAKENLPEVSDENIFEIIAKKSEADDGNKVVIEAKKIIETVITVHDPMVIHPKFKMEGIFNDENLTEDYELGFRFHQLGLKTGFFNVQLDSHNEATRIATAEFFPNKFWPSVKQRSRWIAGICLQNWKAHKWKGNLTTKYFLFRDRKPLFSLFGAFFSNMIFLYLIYAVVCNVFKISNPVVMISSNSVLWYLIIANLFFMVSRASQRFVFTYNWYGFRFAFFSLFRLLIDTFINFFAVLRSLKVFRQTKTKVVWDATTHY